MVKKCLWIAVATGKCVTNKMVNDDIAYACREAESKTEKQWLKHPLFKQNLIEMGKQDESFPSTIIEGLREFTTEEDMKVDLDSWKYWTKKLGKEKVSKCSFVRR